MRDQPARRGNKGFIILGVIVALIFCGVAIFLTSPHNLLGYASTLGFGILLTLGLILLTVLDGRARSRTVRFFTDWICGTILLVLVHVFLIGIDPQWLFLLAGTAVIALISLIAALTTKFVAVPNTEDVMDDEDNRMRRRRH